MNINYVLYDPNTGKIKQDGSAPPSQISSQNIAGFVRLEELGSYETDYVDLNTLEVKPKTTFNLTLNKTIVTADGVDSITSSNVPVGTELYFDGETYIIDDGELEITLDVTGTYELYLSYPQHTDEVITIEGI